MPIRHVRRKYKSFLYKLKKVFIKLFKLHSTPHEIALGVALGVFIAIMPVYGLHTVLVLLLFFLIRKVNLIAMFIGTNISLPPTLPFITWAGYNIGRLILGKKYPEMSWDTLGKFIIEVKNFIVSIPGLLIHWEKFKELDLTEISNFYFPLLVGSAVLGLGCAGIFYFIVYRFIKRRHTRRHARRHRHQECQ